jgi:elongation factor 2
MYAKQLKCDEDYLMSRLWGDNYYDPASKKWTTSEVSEVNGDKLERGFVQFIMNPIIKFVRAIMDDNTELVEKICKSKGVVLTNEEKEMKGKHLMRAIFMKWINAAESLLEMIVTKLPSPVVA